jgi:hypothetical protein
MSGLAAELAAHFDPASQIGPAQIEVIASLIRARGPGCRLLVFGLGHDTALWCAVNRDGDTVILEDRQDYIGAIAAPGARLVAVDYRRHTRVLGALRLDLSELDAAIMPAELKGAAFDVVLIDGPAGYHMDDPGRALPIYWTAKIMTRSTHIFVDDYNRAVERHFSDLLLRFDNPPCTELPHDREPGKRMLWRIGRSLP